jgi:isopentenyl-diphosphate delta-isomerase
MADELLDVVNDEDIVVGQEIRSAVHRQGLQHRGVHVFLFNTDRKLLVQKRSADRASSPSMLDCSISEHVKAGESYLDAAIRGMREEMGVEGIDIKPLVTFRMNYGPNDNEISTLYEGTIETGDIQFDPVEIAETGFYTVRELQQQMAEESKKFCGWFIEIFNWYIGQQSKLTVLKTE